MAQQIVEIRSLKDLERAARRVGLPVGSRKGRSKEKKEWYVLLGFLRAAIPSQIVELPIVIRNGIPPDEPDFIVTRANNIAELFEITEATDEADQREMTAFERSGNSVMLLGEFGGRFKDGAARLGQAWATDIVEAIRGKTGKIIFRDSAAKRHLLVYPNSNASSLLFDEEDEREAIDHLLTQVAHDVSLTNRVNGCAIHVLGGYLVCVDALREMKLLMRSHKQPGAV
jgi:hypothetical protein